MILGDICYLQWYFKETFLNNRWFTSNCKVKIARFYRFFIVDFRRPCWWTKTVYQYGVSIQSSTKVHETFRQITQKLWATKTWNLDKSFIFESFITFHFLGFFHWTVSNLFFCCVTVKTIYSPRYLCKCHHLEFWWREHKPASPLPPLA